MLESLCEFVAEPTIWRSCNGLPREDPHLCLLEPPIRDSLVVGRPMRRKELTGVVAGFPRFLHEGNALLEITAMNISIFDAQHKFIEKWIAKPKIVADCIKTARKKIKMTSQSMMKKLWEV